jgi:hypothetical protein
MGYRALLKKVLAAIEEETGSLPLATLERQAGTRFSRRDLGELRALAAELCREGSPRRRPSLVPRSSPPPEPPTP